MTGKEKALVNERLNDRKASNAEIVLRAGYNAKDTHSASQIYLNKLKNIEIAKKLDDVAEEMEDTLITTVRRYKDSDKLGEVTLANDTARWIHDKAKGKATQRTENVSVSLSFGMDLTGTTQLE